MKLKKETLPHLIIWGVFFLIIIIGIITNSGAVGTMLGTFAGIVTDPVSSAIALVAGAAVTDYKKFLITILFVGALVSILILFKVTGYRSELGLSVGNSYVISAFAYRMVVFVLVAHLSNAVRLKIKSWN